MSPQPAFLPGGCVHFFPDSRECGGHGVCVQVAASAPQECACEPLFASLGDISVDPANPCNIYTPIIRAEWAVACLMLSMSLAACSFILAKRAQTGKLTWALKSQWLHFALFDIESVLFIAFGILKIIDPTYYSVGNHASATILYSFGAFFFWTGVFIALWWIMHVGITTTTWRLSSQAKDAYESFFAWVKRLSYIAGLLNVVWCFSPVILLTRKDLVPLVAGFHSIGLAFSMLMGAFFVGYFLSRMIRDIEGTLIATAAMRNADDKQLRKVLKKMRFVRLNILFNALSQCAIAFFFGLWPIMYSALSYQFPLAWTVGAIASTTLAYMVDNSRAKPNSTLTAQSSSGGDAQRAVAAVAD